MRDIMPPWLMLVTMLGTLLPLLVMIRQYARESARRRVAEASVTRAQQAVERLEEINRRLERKIRRDDAEHTRMRMEMFLLVRAAGGRITVPAEEFAAYPRTHREESRVWQGGALTATARYVTDPEAHPIAPLRLRDVPARVAGDAVDAVRIDSKP